MDADCKPKLKQATAPEGAVPPRVRTWWLDSGIMLCGMAVLTVAFWLEPTPDGSAVKPQLQPSCPFRVMTSLPCGTCGMTRAFVWAVRGEWGMAARMQPFGLLLFVLMIGAMIDAAMSLTTGRTIRRVRLPWKKVAVVLAILFLAAWIYRILATLGYWE